MAGAGYKLFNTGDVLTAAQVNTYLMEQTVMVFADAAARTTALTGVLSEGMISYLKDTNAVEVYNGSAWVASDDPNAIQNTIVDAKGDLITATAADTPARLAVGGNNTFLRANSATTTGLEWAGTYTTFTPSWTNLTVGNGTNNGRYLRIGDFAHVKVNLVFGSTTSVSGTIINSFPLPANTTNMNTQVFGNVHFLDSAIQNYLGTCYYQSSTGFYVVATNTSGTYAFASFANATTPFTFGTNDEIVINYVYEVA